MVANDLLIERVTELSGECVALLHEYYEAVHVIKRDTPADITEMLSGFHSGFWIARLRGEAAGCVALRNLASVPHAGECKRLYVRPAYRRLRIADRLLDALEDHARSVGLQWIYLDSYDDLRSAISLYRRRGYTDCARYNDNPQATIFLRKNIAQS